MSSNRRQQIEDIFQTARDLTPEDRDLYITRACAGDSDLKRDVESLLTQNKTTGDLSNETLSLDVGPDTLASLMKGEADPLLGSRVGAYRIEREIGRGGMGAVYEAVRADNVFRKRVAVKVVKRGMDTDFILRRFRNERQILAALDHVNIARLLDGGTTDEGLPFFVMEFIEGQPLYGYCDTQRLTIPERLRLFQQICEAVHYAHEKRVIHRDIKPSNIHVSSEGIPKLLDFGIAKLLDPELASETIDITLTAIRLMTPEYASPEQVKGDTVTPASDIYSLGVVLYELLSGHRPYRLKNRALHEVARIICEEEPESISESLTRDANFAPNGTGEKASLEALLDARNTSMDSLRRDLSGDLERIIMKSLRKEPALRYQTASDLRDDITRFLGGQPVAAPPYIQPSARQTSPLQRANTGELSLAVLPFKVLGPRVDDDTGDEYLGVGLADALITRLSNVRLFIVRPTSSVLAYSSGDTGDPLAAGLDLGVDYIVDGRIRRVGEILRVTVQLLQVGEGATRWAARFDEKFTDVLRLEDSISEQVANALIPQLAVEERQQLAKRGTYDERAFEAYLRGRYHWHSLTEEGFAKALQDYYRAIALDPHYALAYAGIADYYIFLGVYGVMPFAESSAAAIEAAMRALELDPTLAEAHAALGFAIHCHDLDWPTAEKSILRSLELNSHSATAHDWYSFILLSSARFDEALREVTYAVELDPVSPLVTVALGWCHYQSRRFDEALAVNRKVVEADPRFPYGRLMYSWSLRRIGRHEEAIEQAKKAVKLSGGTPLYLTGLGAAYAEAGREQEARKTIRQLLEMSQSIYVSPYMLALIHIHLGDQEQALDFMEQALAIRDGWVMWFAVDPQLDPLRSNPRFDELTRQTNNPAAFKSF